MYQQSGGYERRTSSGLPYGPATLLLGAGSVILYGLSRRSLAGMALAASGGAIAWKAAQAQPRSRAFAHATFLVNAPAEKTYEMWRNFENLPRFMAHLDSVRVLDRNHSEWVARGPLNREFRWSAEITEDEPNRRIEWRSLPDSEILTVGSVTFRPDPQGRGTFVRAHVQYMNPGGTAGRALAALVGKHPQFMVREDLRRFKALVETGEAPTICGQTHGPRGLHGRTERVLFRETTNHSQPQAA